MVKTTIQIDVEIWKMLNEMKTHPGFSHNMIIENLIKFYDSCKKCCRCGRVMELDDLDLNDGKWLCGSCE